MLNQSTVTFQRYATWSVKFKSLKFKCSIRAPKHTRTFCVRAHFLNERNLVPKSPNEICVLRLIRTREDLSPRVFNSRVLSRSSHFFFVYVAPSTPVCFRSYFYSETEIFKNAFPKGFQPARVGLHSFPLLSCKRYEVIENATFQLLLLNLLHPRF